MKLLLDIGNTRAKVALAGEDGLRTIYSGALSVGVIRDLTKGIPVEGGLWCSTRGTDPGIESCLADMGVLRLTHETPVPLKNCYSSPERLGMDRLAAAVGAWCSVPHDGRPILVVDAGTAVTYDLISGQGEFLGGNIAPGIGLRLKALHEHTGALPLVSARGELPLFGYDTETAIRAGVIRGINYELDGCITALKSVHGNLFIFLTGGDCDYFDIKGKSDIFAVNNLLFRGLEYIVGYNEKK